MSTKIQILIKDQAGVDSKTVFSSRIAIYNVLYCKRRMTDDGLSLPTLQ